MTELEVECFPKDLPEFFEVDISGLEMDQMLHVSDIKLPEGVEISDAIKEQDQVIVSIHEVKEIIEEEIIDEEVEGEGETGAEGEDQSKPEGQSDKDTSKDDNPDQEKSE